MGVGDRNVGEFSLTPALCTLHRGAIQFWNHRSVVEIVQIIQHGRCVSILSSSQYTQLFHVRFYSIDTTRKVLDHLVVFV